jgi:hypothetical protein
VVVAAVTAAFTGPKYTILLAAVALKPVPVMVTVIPTAPLAGEKLLMIGCAKTTWTNSRARKLKILFLTMALQADSVGQMDMGFI